MEKCYRCSGLGYLETIINSYAREYMTETCPACNGTGKGEQETPSAQKTAGEEEG